MTNDKYINDNQTKSFNKGDSVVMFDCFESTIDKYKNKIWICQTDSFSDKSGQDVVFLEGYSGYFSTKFLKLV